jgi:putative tributyrin esterase
MKRSLLLIILSLIVFAPAAHAQSASQSAKPAAQSTPRTPCKEGQVCVETVQFESRLVGASLPYNVVLPADYKLGSSKQKRYAVVYLLHGLAGSAGDWVSNRAHLTDYAARYDFIIVVPEGRDGWYTDGLVPNEKFESYFVQELIPDVDRRFRTFSTRDARAVAGLSMGGYGALKFGLKHPELFVFAASMSGALHAATWIPDESLIEFARPSIARVYGKTADNDVRRANDIYRIVKELPAERVASLPYFYLDCGTEDFLISNSRDFSALLIEKKIPHEFRELPGEHNWPYWDRQVQEVLKIASQKLAPAREAKAASVH